MSRGERRYGKEQRPVVNEVTDDRAKVQVRFCSRFSPLTVVVSSPVAFPLFSYLHPFDNFLNIMFLK